MIKQRVIGDDKALLTRRRVTSDRQEPTLIHRQSTTASARTGARQAQGYSTVYTAAFDTVVQYSTAHSTTYSAAQSTV